jgi:creatinine amidohydrolase
MLSSRSIGNLTYPEVSEKLRETSILCLPVGAIEQHGAHLPLNTDVVVAEGITRALVNGLGEELDLWQLPTISISLSREHDWAPGTLSLSAVGFAGHLLELARGLVRGLPARNLAIINGHGGNRGILDGLLHELRAELALNACVLHPFDLAKVGNKPGGPDVHGGVGETSVMLALAPELVRKQMIAGPGRASEQAVAALIFDRGVSFPWCSDDPRLAQRGIIGDPAAASAELGQAMIDSMIEAAGAALRRLLENQRMARMG